MKRLTLLILLCITTLSTKAQFTKVYLGIDGLTCSQCSRSVEMHLRKLKFIDQIDMDLEHADAVLLLDTNKKADFYKIAASVTSAGFSVRYLRADFKGHVAEGAVFKYKSQVFKFDTPHNISPSGIVNFVFLDPAFLPNEKRNNKDGNKQTNTYHIRID